VPVRERPELLVELRRPVAVGEHHVAALVEVVDARRPALLVLEEAVLLTAVGVLAAHDSRRGHPVEQVVAERLALDVLGHHTHDEAADVYSNVVNELKDAHRPNHELLADPVHHVGGLGRAELAGQPLHLGRRVQDVAHEVAVPDEARDVVGVEDLLPEPLRELLTQLDELGPDAIGRDELEQLLNRRRVVEMIADDAAVERDALVYHADGDGRRVRQVVGVRAERVHFSQDVELYVLVLDDRLENEPRPLDSGQRRRRAAHGESLLDERRDDVSVLDEVLAIRVETPQRDDALLSELRQLSAQVGQKPRERLLVHVNEVQHVALVLPRRYREPRHLLGEKESDPAPHLARRAKHGHVLQPAVKVHAALPSLRS